MTEPIQYRGFFTRSSPNIQYLHIFEWRKNKTLNVVSIYFEAYGYHQWREMSVAQRAKADPKRLAHKLFRLSKMSSEDEKQILLWQLQEAFYVRTGE